MDVEITELEKIDADRVDGVSSPANGIQFIMMKQVAKGARDCPKCERSYDADHEGDKCENCGTTLPVAKAADDEDMEGSDSDGVIVEDGKPCPTCGQAVDGTIVRAHVRHNGAAKADGDMVDCPTCKGDGKIRGDSTNCPDCKAKGKVTPARRDAIVGKSLSRIIAGAPGVDWNLPLLLKAVGADGQVDEQPDIDVGDTILHLIGQAIANEAQELMAGKAGEIRDIIQLAYAAENLWEWRTGEQAVAAGSVMPADALMQSAAHAAIKAATAGIISFSDAAEIVKDSRNFSEDDRKKAAGEGNALPDGSYPIPDADALRRAAILARSGHGDVDAAKKLIARRSKELGVDNPLDSDALKGVIADAPVIGDTDHGTAEQPATLGKSVEDLTKALAASKERETSLEAELAKVKATPVPGGPMMTAVPSRKQDEVSDKAAAKATYFDEWAERVSDPSVAEEYRTLAARERAKITAS